LRLLSLTPADLSFCAEAASFLQSAFWGSFKARFGWNARAFRVSWAASPERDRPLLVIRRRLGPGISFAYVPWGPELPEAFSEPGERNAALLELALSLKAFLPKDTSFVRFDPPWYAEEGAAGGATADAALPSAPFIRAGADVQPPDTVLIDLSGGEEAVLAGMKPKWRYNARLALKRGVLVHRTGEEGLASFYDLLKETAARDGIAIHGIEYYRTLFTHSRESPSSPDIRLYLAGHEGDVLAGIMTLFRGRDAVYLYGASSDRKRNLMAPYALQLKAMEDARLAGCAEYDLFGIPPGEDPDHPMAGLYRFKTGFGGRIVHRIGSWDLAYRPFAYRLFRTTETLRKNLRTLKKKRALSRRGKGGGEE
jgi:lipid II:glycine glycyltransferase (peptidoglycan interpeptide bridge formation enzyme)